VSSATACASDACVTDGAAGVWAARIHGVDVILDTTAASSDPHGNRHEQDYRSSAHFDLCAQ
jgi:hypothetical protein